ncbi:SDR family oxidoreductase [Candidatus Dojkabacteria bacterium]|uniref:SDR family oxidoreductase n=1 Tax=Candidatus Dojkabacteria bacterium TaxID=2099670 RepID=A0A955L5B2_9BACT|nr:SDR family oxidoreductase [Candidatus Dojkabacteria bacterium]
MENLDRVALVTGANKGIGRGIVAGLVSKGFQVILASRDLDKGLRTQEELKTDGMIVDCIQLDVTNLDSIKQAVAIVAEKYQKLDILVNNAGIVLDDDLDSTNLTDEILHETMNVNLYGAYRVTREFLNLIRNGSDSRIINMSSGMGSLTSMGSGNLAYRVSKTALNAMTKVLAEELKHDGINVYTMSPGWVKTDMGGPGATKSIEEGADTAIWLATENPAPETGLFYEERQRLAW